MTDLFEWLKCAERDLRQGTNDVMSIDLDQIADSRCATTWNLRTALDVYVRSLSVLPRSAPWVVSLAISLFPCDDLDSRVPSVADLEADLSDSQPPGLYLIHPRTFLKAWTFVEFRAPFDLEDVLPTTIDSVTGRYVCFRTPEAMQKKWEWSRVVWLDRWPLLPVMS